MRKTLFNYVKCNNNNNNGYSWLPTIYTGKPVEKSNGSLHSVLEATENMGYDLRRCNISTFTSLRAEPKSPHPGTSCLIIHDLIDVVVELLY